MSGFIRRYAVNIIPTDYAENEAWILFRLNEVPIRTEQDGDFDALALMDVATGIIVGMDMVSASSEEITEIEARRLLKAGDAQVGFLPCQIYVAAEAHTAQFSATARAMGATVEAVPGDAFSEITEEARVGFTKHVLGVGNHEA